MTCALLWRLICFSFFFFFMNSSVADKISCRFRRVLDRDHVCSPLSSCSNLAAGSGCSVLKGQLRSVSLFSTREAVPSFTISRSLCGMHSSFRPSILVHRMRDRSSVKGSQKFTFIMINSYRSLQARRLIYKISFDKWSSSLVLGHGEAMIHSLE